MTDNKLKVLREWAPFEYKKINEGRGGNEKIIMRGILQKADVLNQNGRIYPRDILEAEIQNYQKFIIENRALGELDHPECVPRDTMIKTIDGWKSITDVKVGDHIFTLDAHTNEIQIKPIQRKIDQAYKGKMIRIRNSRSIDMMVTPNHRVLVYDRHGDAKFITAMELKTMYDNKNPWLNKCSLRYGGTWLGKEPTHWNLPGTDIEIPIEDWLAFLGIYLAEGHSAGTKSKKTADNSVVITQTHNGRRNEMIRELFKRLPFKHKIRTTQELNRDDFCITHAQLHDYLFELGHSDTKYIPAEFKNLSPRLLNILLDWMLMGDGRNRRGHQRRGKKGIIDDKSRILRELATISPRLAEDTDELFLKTGRGAKINTYKQKTRTIDGGTSVILEENSQPINIISERESSYSCLDSKFLKIEEVDFDDRVYCVTVENGTWLMKYNNAICWTGNSSVVELKNVSHIVREAKMDREGVVWGAIEVLPTPAGNILKSLVEAGVTIGISSRGVGSTKTEGGKTLVQDDFQLICWDIVSEPSTPNAFIMREGRDVTVDELKKLRESRFTKDVRLDRIFNEVLTWRKK